MAALTGKTAVVTGGNSGIGLATAKRFVQEGAFVFITGRRKDELDKAVAAIGSNIVAIQGDISNLEDLDRLYAKVSAEKGKIDVLVANAGFVQVAMTPDVTAELYDKITDTNSRGTYFTVQKALPHLNDRASIILIGSALWHKGYPAQSVYASTKATLRSFVRTWTTELKDRKIRSNVISPGGVDTPMLDGLVPSPEAAAAMKKQMEEMVPLGRIGRPEDIASAALFLASDESSYITGNDLVIDGGITLV